VIAIVTIAERDAVDAETAASCETSVTADGCRAGTHGQGRIPLSKPCHDGRTARGRSGALQDGRPQPLADGPSREPPAHRLAPWGSGKARRGTDEFPVTLGAEPWSALCSGEL